jgi:hypothetical protein
MAKKAGEKKKKSLRRDYSDDSARFFFSQKSSPDGGYPSWIRRMTTDETNLSFVIAHILWLC